MRLLELVARKTEMHEVMLTVQHQNADALRMYRRYITLSSPFSLFRFRMLITGSCLVRGLPYHYLMPALMVHQTDLLKMSCSAACFSRAAGASNCSSTYLSVLQSGL
jgi:hypothetical protein